MRCESPLHTAYPDRALLTMGVEIIGPWGLGMVVVGSCCSQNAQGSQVALLQLGGNVRDQWYVLMCVWFLCDGS
jgi:hypothetical protein